MVDLDQDSDTVYFHIFSVNGKRVSEFLDIDSILDKMHANTVLFSSGTEFLVCKREQVGVTLHIYIREICLGFSKNVVFWCDDKLSSVEYLKFHRWLRMKSVDD